MVNMTLTLTEELKKRMDKHPEMNWSEVARQAFAKKIRDMEILEEFTKDSTMTEEDALRLGREVRKGVAKKIREARQEHGHSG